MASSRPPVFKQHIYQCVPVPSEDISGSCLPPNRSTRMSMRAFDSNTDTDIFSLGSAFKDGQINIDDFFKDFKGHGLHDHGPGNVETVTTTSQSQDGGCTTTVIRKISIPEPQKPKVTYLSQRSRCIPAPFSTEYSMCNHSAIPPCTPKPHDTAGSTPKPHETAASTPKPQETVAFISKPQETPAFTPKSQDNFGTSNQAPTPSAESAHKDEDHKEDTRIAIERHDSSCSDNEIEFQRILKHRVKRKYNKGNQNPHTNKLKFRALLHQKRHSADVSMGGAKGRVGMAVSQLTAPGVEQKLPAITQMVLNFSRMLTSHRAQFIEMLFRAVKLNGVEAVKLMCELALRKGFKLSSNDMRESESSATVLHVALLFNHESIADYLIDLKDRDLIMATYTNDEYRNQTALHVAVANGNQRLVLKLMDSLGKKDQKVLVNTVATGTYFRKNHLDGQLCLTAAAWAGSGEMLVTLIKHGANFTLANTKGDTLMHRIIHASVACPNHIDSKMLIDKVFSGIGEWAKRCRYNSNIPDQRLLEQKQKQINAFHKLLNIQNDDGETALMLAAKKGSNMLVHLMNLENIFKVPQTRLGSISWVTYDVTDIASFAHDYYNKFSVLHILAHNSGKLSRHASRDEDAVSFLDTEPIKSIIDLKWAVYRWVYVFWLILHVVFMACFTASTFNGDSTYYEEDYHEMRRSETYGAILPPIKHWLCVFLLLPVAYIVLEFLDWFGTYPYSIMHMQNQQFMTKIIKRIQSEWVITGNGPYRFVCLFYSIFTLSWYIHYILRHRRQNAMLAMSLLFGWIFVLFFTRGCRVCSRFSIMIQKMFFRDLMYFLAVYVVILAAFSISITAMFSYKEQEAGTGYFLVVYQMLNIVTGLDEKNSFDEAREQLFTKMLLIFYAIVAVILLMNMLIAMMNTSYETVRVTRCNLCKQQQLSIMLMIERRLFWIKSLCRRSERDVWEKEWDRESVRAYLDITMMTGSSSSK